MRRMGTGTCHTTQSPEVSGLIEPLEITSGKADVKNPNQSSELSKSKCLFIYLPTPEFNSILKGVLAEQWC